MRLVLLITLLFVMRPAKAADIPSSFVFMPAYWYEYHWEETPDSLGKKSQRQMLFTAAWRGPYGLCLGGTWLKNSSFAQDSRVTLSAQGLSVGFIGAGYLSAFYTVLYNPTLDYDFPTVNAKASYFGGSGSIMDLGFHFGNSWLRFGPRMLLVDVSYKSSTATTGNDIETSALEGSPWRDRWLEPYLGLWLIF